MDTKMNTFSPIEPTPPDTYLYLFIHKYIDGKWYISDKYEELVKSSYYRASTGEFVDRLNPEDYFNSFSEAVSAITKPGIVAPGQGVAVPVGGRDLAEDFSTHRLSW